MEIFPNWTVVPILLVLVILTYLLNRLFFRPLAATLDERHKKIEGAKGEADQIRHTVQARQEEFERLLREARRESDRQIAGMKNQALEEKTALISTRRSEAEQMVEQARNDIRQKTQEAREELKRQAAQFASRIASRILKRPVNG